MAAPILPRFRRHEEAAEDYRRTSQRLRESGEPAQTTKILSLLGDERQLRGIPAIGRGVRGAIAGTIPDAAFDDIRTSRYR